MRRFRLGFVLAAVGLLSGCGGGKKDPPTQPAVSPAVAATPTPTPTPTRTPSHGPPLLTSASDLAACAQLEQVVSAVSSLIGHTTEGITQALHASQLAERTGTAQQSLIGSAHLVGLVKQVPEPLVGPQLQLQRGLRMFAADFGRAKASAAKGDINRAADQTVDKTALRTIQKSVKRIDDLCGR